jgi:Mg-chelatase subunit ChlD
MLHRLVKECVGDQNLEGMAACLAVDMAGAAALAPADFVTDAVGHKGIGGGTNLLKQWFDARDRLDSEMRGRIKALAKTALTDLAFHWAGKGTGSTEQGMVPQQRARPFRGGDDLDMLDIESTLDAIISAGKPLDQVTAEDLFVPETSRGKAAMCVLIDISGSMGGRELANCAISVVMLLGRLAPSEAAVALFESDTHVVKPFESERDLDDVADQILDLRATGGTRVDRALEWVADQFDTVPEAEMRLMFLLSDYQFFEGEAELRKRLARLAAADVHFLGAAHGSISKETAGIFQTSLTGEWVPLRNLDRVPALLQEAITRIGSGW